MSVSLETIVAKVRAMRPLYNVRGEPITLNREQISVIRYMCDHGLQHKQIAGELALATREVSEVLASVMRATGCKNHGQLGAWAAKAGLV